MITRKEFVEAAELIHRSSNFAYKAFVDGFRVDVPFFIDDLSSLAVDLLLKHLSPESPISQIDLNNIYNSFFCDELFNEEFFRDIYDDYVAK